MKKIKAFTLAEVLITLAIIGVVAALTIPTVVTNYKNKALETQKKKSISVLTNGFRLLMAQDNVSSLRDTKLASCDVSDKDCIKNEIKKVFSVILDDTSTNDEFNKEYQFTSEPKAVWNDAGFKYVFVTSDGMIFGLKTPGRYKVGQEFEIIADVNGAKNPNKGAQDLCRYFIGNEGIVFDECWAMEDWERTRVCSAQDPGACNSETCSAAGGIWHFTRCWEEHGHQVCTSPYCSF